MLFLYQLLLPVLFLCGLPGWLVKTARRGGWNRHLAERFGIFRGPPDFEPCGATHIHAVSVGEALLALKLIRVWQEISPGERFVLALGTPTGRAVAEEAGLENVRVAYQPFDLPFMVRAYLRRFEPHRVVLIEGEVWPNFMRLCQRRKIPVSLVNARMSPRSARRYRKFAALLRPVFSKLAKVCTQHPGDAAAWHDLGVASVATTGSLKFDPGTALPRCRDEFTEILAAWKNRPVILAASTHPGEETYLANAIHDAAPHALPVIAPRHAERAAEVARHLHDCGFDVHRRSNLRSPAAGHPLLLIDTTGELRDWTAHADIVLIGKSFLGIGGQTPAEAILAEKPLIFGPHMENFEPLATALVHQRGALVAGDAGELASAIRTILSTPEAAAAQTRAALRLLQPHEGAARRMIAEIMAPPAGGS